MPVPSTCIYIYRSPREFPSSVWQALKDDPENSNVILPHAIKHFLKERLGETCVPSQYWIVSGSYDLLLVDFILSCAEGPLGAYPVFICATRPFNELIPEYTSPHLRALVDALAKLVPHHRVFSVFSPEPLARQFGHLWAERTGVAVVEDYYVAKQTHCTLKSFIDRRMTCFADLDCELRLALESDLPQAGALCYNFAASSHPFLLTMEKALEEATQYYQNNQLWVHTIAIPGEEPEIASIVVTSRESETVSTISKVYSNPKWRKRGCAQRLVRYVCKHLLTKAGKESVVLYVANDNVAAAKVYHRVGFVGLGENDDGLVDGVDQWVEVGFDRSKVKLGHW